MQARRVWFAKLVLCPYLSFFPTISRIRHSGRQRSPELPQPFTPRTRSQRSGGVEYSPLNSQCAVICETIISALEHKPQTKTKGRKIFNIMTDRKKGNVLVSKTNKNSSLQHLITPLSVNPYVPGAALQLIFPHNKFHVTFALN